MDRTAGVMLAKWRRLLGYTQGDAAALAEVQQPTWSAWEQEKQVPPEARAEKIETLTHGFVPASAWDELRAAKAATPAASSGGDVEIVSLADPRDGVVRFVGASVRDDLVVFAWVRELAAIGVTPIVRLLETVSEKRRDRAEAQWREAMRQQGAVYFPSPLAMTGTDGGR